MAEDVLASLQAIDPAVLTQVVREDQRSATFHIADWAVSRLSEKGIFNPDGLWLFSGQGSDEQGARPWSVVLKILQRPEPEESPDSFWYWKRELHLAKSGLLNELPGPVRAPRFYGTEETPDGGRIWMEYVRDSQPGRWTLENYVFAAHLLGRWNGACLQPVTVPDYPWLIRQYGRRRLQGHAAGEYWQFPLIRDRLSAEVRARYDRLWAEHEMYIAALESLPQVFSHFDCQRRNLFIRHEPGQTDELVAVDWAFAGVGPLGAELFNLVAASVFLLEWSPTDLRELDAAAFEKYIEGLQDAGWRGESPAVRLGQTAWTAIYYGCGWPALAAWACAADMRQYSLRCFGYAEEELFWQWVPLLDYALDCADEARILIEKLGVKK